MIEYLYILLNLLNEIPSPETTHIIILNGIRIFFQRKLLSGEKISGIFIFLSWK